MTCSKGDYVWLLKHFCLWVPQHHLEQMSISRLWDSLALDPSMSMVLFPAVRSVWSREQGEEGATMGVQGLWPCSNSAA